MSPTTKALVWIGVSVIVKIAILNGIGYAARRQLKKTRPDLVRYHNL